MTASATEGGGIPVLVGGYPNDEDISLLYDELDYQRACQAYIWATPMPARGAATVR